MLFIRKSKINREDSNMKKKIIFIVFTLVVITSVFFFTRDDGLEKYVFNDEEYGEITLYIPEETVDMSFEGIHLLMKRSDVEKLDLIDNYEKAGLDAGNYFGYTTDEEVPAQLYGDYSVLSDGEYLDETGENKPDLLVYSFFALKSKDDFFGIVYDQPFHEAANTLLDQGFEYVKGREDKDTGYIYYEMFKKGDLYIILKNGDYLRLAKRQSDLNLDLDRVKEIRVEIKTDVDEFKMDENFEIMNMLSEIESSSELLESEIVVKRPVEIKKVIDSNVDINTESIIYTNSVEVISEVEDISYTFKTSRVSDEEAVISLNLNTNGRNLEIAEFPRIYKDESLVEEIDYSASMNDGGMVLLFESDSDEVFIQSPEFFVFEEMNNVMSNFSLEYDSDNDINLNNKKWLEITKKTMHQSTIKLSFTARGQKSFAPTRIGVYFDTEEFPSFRNSAIRFDEVNNFNMIEFLALLPEGFDNATEIKVVIEEIMFKVDDRFIEKLIIE
jgi:hypothetical protein